METVLLYILGILIVLLGLVISIGLHEIGHLVPAKLFGVKVGQYMIGFGRTLLSFRRGETEYGLKMIPLGGYISMAGMYPPARAGERGRSATTGMYETLVQDPAAREHEDSPDEERRAFYRLAVWKRVVIMFGGPFMNLLLGILFFGIVLCGFGVPTLTTTIGTVNECLLPATSERTDCRPDDPAAPGAEAGLLPGDRIVSIDGTPIETSDEARAIITTSPGEELPVVIERDGVEQQLTVTPALTEQYVVDDRGRFVEDADGERLVQEVGLFGITWASEIQRQPVTAVLPRTWDAVERLVTVVANLPARVSDLVVTLVSGGERDPEGLIGVVGVGRIAGEITSLDSLPIATRAASLIELIGGLNIALFVFNLIPLPPLDGGHIAAAIIDGIRRGWASLRGRPQPAPIDAGKIIPVTLVVATLLGLLTVLLLVADIFRPISIL